MLVPSESGHPLSFLTLRARTAAAPVSQVYCLAEAAALDCSIAAGEVTIVSEARAVPYPALYESRPPAWQVPDYAAARRQMEVYPLKQGDDQPLVPAALVPSDLIWQKEIRTVVAGYAKNPAWGGALAPWSSQQLARLCEYGLQTWSETCVGAAEFSLVHPEVGVTCWNLITRQFTASQDEWNRQSAKLMIPALMVLEKLCQHCMTTKE